MTEMADNKYQQLLDDGKKYLHMQYDLLRLELLEKLSKIITMLAVGAIALALALAAFVYLSLALVEWMIPAFGGRALPLLIIGCLFLLVIILVVLMRRRLFVEPLLRSLSDILFAREKETGKQPSTNSHETNEQIR